jgi:hypothetical protein
MKKSIWISAAVGAMIGLGFAAAASAAAPGQQAQSTPKSWNYEIKDGKRVPKGDRVVNADGSWREEIRQGKCVTVKEKSSAGEYRESRRCD